MCFDLVSLSQTDLGNVECLKTCCGALAILAKDESNKLLIARDGTRLILTVMEGHATRPDLQVRLFCQESPVFQCIG